MTDREEALKDSDYPLTGSAYDDDEDDVDDDWAGDETTWTEDADAEEESDIKDESSAYLEFLSEEVRPSTNGIYAHLLTSLPGTKVRKP
jgi:hypothetical protein